MPARLLVRNGFVASLDRRLGRLSDCVLLVEDGLIAAVGRGLDAGDAEVIDASGTIVLPGFVDTRGHMWQTNVRGVLPSCTLDQYMASVMFGFGSVYRPKGVYTGNMWGALEALNAGVTTVLDRSYCNNTPEHADADVQGLRDSGIRAVYAHGTPSDPGFLMNDALNHPEDARRVRSQYSPGDDDLLTFALALRHPGLCRPEVVAHDWALTRDLDARISVHGGLRVSGLRLAAIQELSNAGLLGADTTYVHLNTSTDAELALNAGSGGSASISPYVEMVIGHGHPPIGRLLDHAVTPSLSVDVTTTVPGDMFTQMRATLAHERISEFSDDLEGQFASTLGHEDVLRFATTAGAAACGLDDKIGTLAPRKQADVVLVRADAVNTFPLVDPIGTVVASADTWNVDTVLVRGEVRKHGGRLIGVDRRPALRDQVQRSATTSYTLRTPRPHGWARHPGRRQRPGNG